MEYVSGSGTATYYTTAEVPAPEGLSSTTALTRSSQSGITGRSSRSSTSGTSYTTQVTTYNQRTLYSTVTKSRITAQMQNNYLLHNSWVQGISFNWTVNVENGNDYESITLSGFSRSASKNTTFTAPIYKRDYEEGGYSIEGRKLSCRLYSLYGTSLAITHKIAGGKFVSKTSTYSKTHSATSVTFRMLTGSATDFRTSATTHTISAFKVSKTTTASATVGTYQVSSGVTFDTRVSTAASAPLTRVSTYYVSSDTTNAGISSTTALSRSSTSGYSGVSSSSYEQSGWR